MRGCEGEILFIYLTNVQLQVQVHNNRTPNPAGDGAYGFTSYPRRRSNVSEASCLSTLTTGLLTPHKWNVRVSGMRSVLSFFVVLTVDQFVGHGGGLLERQKRDSHVYRKTGTLPLIFRKNQSRHYINDEVWETVKKVWNSWRVMDAKMKTTSN